MGHSTLSDTQISGLTRAGANQSQWAVYTALSRFHNLDRYPGNPSWCYRPIADLARITGLHPQTCAKALRVLCTLEFLPGVTVLEKVGGGHRGQASIHADNLWAYSEVMEQEPMPPIGGPLSPTYQAPKGESQGLTNEGGKGESQGLTNQDMERYADTAGKVSRESGKVSRNAPKGKPQGLTQNRNTEEIPRIDVQKDGKESEKGGLAVRLTEERRDAFEDWLWDNVRTTERPGTFYAWWRRLGGAALERAQAAFSTLDAIAAKAPTSDADLSPEDLRAAEAARHDWLTPRLNAWDAWVVLTCNGRRDAEWASLLDR